MSEMNIDEACLPFPRKGVYWIISLLYLAVLAGTAAYLWQTSVVQACVYVALYAVQVVLHGYLCSFGSCPYKGTLCPGAFAWFPVGKLAGALSGLNAVRHSALVGPAFLLIMLALLGTLILPLFALVELGVAVAAGYVAFMAVYFVVFLLAICPRCAMRYNCPAARLSNALHKLVTGKSTLEAR
jgi:hypothetical protein